MKSKFELLELACLAVAEGDVNKLQDVVDLEPPAVKIVEVAMLQCQPRARKHLEKRYIRCFYHVFIMMSS